MPRKISLFLVLAINAFALNGCMVTSLTVSTVPCKMLEHGHTKTFYGVDQGWAALGDGGSGPLTLQEWPPPQWATWLGYLYWFTPRQRVVLGDYNLLDMAFFMVEGKEYQSGKKAPIRWIISNDPIVVAIGTEMEDVGDGVAMAGVPDDMKLGGTYHLVCKKDLDRKVIDLVVMDHKPTVFPIVGSGGDYWDDFRYILETEHCVKHIKLAAPLTLQTIMREQPWKHDGYHPPATKPTAREQAFLALCGLSAKIEFDAALPGKPVVAVDCHDTTNSDMKYFKEFPQLTWLSVGFKITDSGLKQITGLTQLQTLNLGGNNITDAGLKNIMPLNQLQSLNLEGTKITDAGLQQLTGMTQLRHLDLSYTKVTEQAVNKLQEAWPNCKITHTK